jgi:hypothetical protein
MTGSASGAAIADCLIEWHRSASRRAKGLPILTQTQPNWAAGETGSALSPYSCPATSRKHVQQHELNQQSDRILPHSLGPSWLSPFQQAKPSPPRPKALHREAMIFLWKVRKKGGAAYVTRTRDPIITKAMAGKGVFDTFQWSLGQISG